jgi:hypothetical protein
MELPKIVLEGVITSIHHSYASKDSPSLIGHNLNKPMPTDEELNSGSFDWIKKPDPYDYSEIDILTHGVELAVIRPSIPETAWQLNGKENNSSEIRSGCRIRLTLEILPEELQQ